MYAEKSGHRTVALAQAMFDEYNGKYFDNRLVGYRIRDFKYCAGVEEGERIDAKKVECWGYAFTEPKRKVIALDLCHMDWILKKVLLDEMAWNAAGRSSGRRYNLEIERLLVHGAPISFSLIFRGYKPLQPSEVPLSRAIAEYTIHENIALSNRHRHQSWSHMKPKILRVMPPSVWATFPHLSERRLKELWEVVQQGGISSIRQALRYERHRIIELRQKLAAEAGIPIRKNGERWFGWGMSRPGWYL